jgi:hypothetical protein
MIEVIKRDKVLENTREVGAHIAAGVRRLRADFPEIADIRQVGLHVGVEFAQPDADLTPMPKETVAIRDAGIERGCIFGLGGARKQVLKIKPPLVTTRKDADEILGIFEDSVAAVLRPSRKAAQVAVAK